ncbi:MAG: DUF4174 domain-containing protein [Rhodobacteraceae bacterium]|nr:DUF4174 domain-containing protein [Paracoccaceae bacterium]
MSVGLTLSALCPLESGKAQPILDEYGGLSLRRIILLLALALPIAGGADEADPLAEYLWLNRPLVVFADTPNDPRYIRQMEYLAQYPDDLAERDIVVLTDTDPAAKSPLRRKMRPHGFMLVIIDKDGSIAFRKPSPWSIREIGRAIDKTPLRQDEIMEKLGK